MRALLAGVVIPAALQGQGIADYYRLVPPAPRIVAQQPASVRLALYGDRAAPEYRDVAPTDGIDDARAVRLLQIAERFSPLLRRNNFSIPMSVEQAHGSAVRVFADTWLNGYRVRADTILMGAPLRVPRYGEVEEGAAAPGDSTLLVLLQTMHPRRVEPVAIAPSVTRETVLYFDLPGHDEGSWRAFYSRRPVAPHVYVHFFVDEAAPAGGEPRYDFVAQYWFYYPFNDGANNHEGDWEHLNVSITTADRARYRTTGARVGTGLTESDTRRLLDGSMPLDSLVIGALDYYFHHSVVTIDMASLDTTLRPALVDHDLHPTTHVWEDAGFVPWVLRHRLAAAGGLLQTHPIAYIGGDNKGPDELVQMWPRFAASYNRDAHGTYPFPGIWVAAGQMVLTEAVQGSIVPRLRPGADTLPWHKAIADPTFVTFTRHEMTLVPDWERLDSLALVDAVVRRRWAWLLLPIRAGYPASQSLGAGMLWRQNLGQAAPFPPQFQASWNDRAESFLHQRHDFTVQRMPIAPVTPFAALQSGFGFLNIPLAVLGLMPGYNVAIMTVLPYYVGALRVIGAPPPRTMFKGRMPFRVTSTGFGLAWQDAPAFGHLVVPAGTPAKVHSRLNAAQRATFNLHYGRRVAMENSFSWASSILSASERGSGASHAGSVRVRELTGGMRIAPVVSPGESAQLYLRSGYGWTRYDASRNTPVPARERGGKLPSILPSGSWIPNALYGGVGVELFAPKRHWLLHRSGYGVRGDLTFTRHGLRSKEAPERREIVRARSASVSLVLGW